MCASVVLETHLLGKGIQEAASCAQARYLRYICSEMVGGAVHDIVSAARWRRGAACKFWEARFCVQAWYYILRKGICEARS